LHSVDLIRTMRTVHSSIISLFEIFWEFTRKIQQSCRHLGCSRNSPWRTIKVKWVIIEMPNAYFDSPGLFLRGPHSALVSRTAKYSPLRYVVWEGEAQGFSQSPYFSFLKALLRNSACMIQATKKTTITNKIFFCAFFK
jgi:hypothetical protein